MKTLKIIPVFLISMVLLWSCREGPQGPAGPPGDDPTDLHLPLRVVWVWLDSPRPFCYFCNSLQKQTDSLPIGFTPGRLLIRFNKIMVSYTVIPNISLLPKEDGWARLSNWGAISIDGQTFEWPIQGFFKVGQSYTVTIKKEVTDVTGKHLITDSQRYLTPEPNFRIVNTYPQPNDTSVALMSWYFVYFNSPLDSNSFKNKVTISPSVSGRWIISQYDLRTASFAPDSAYQPSTWYQVKFAEGLKDTSNNSLPADVITLFKTTPLIKK